MRRGVRLVFIVIGAAVVISFAGIALLYALLGRGPSVPDSATLVLRPGGDLEDVLPNDVVGQILGRDVTTLRGMIDDLRKAKRDPRITTVLLEPTTLTSPYWGKVQELRDAITDFRSSGKKVIAYLEYGGDREYYLASAADRVFLLPTSPLDLTGVSSYEIFLRGTLDAIGAYPDYLRIGRYKTAPNQLTEKQMTPAHREMTESLNRDAYEQLVRGIAQARHKSEAEVRALMDRGPFLPEDALREGLVDDLAYEDQLDDRVPELRTRGGRTARVEGADYRRVDARSVGIRPRARIAIVYAVGTIASGKSSFDPVNGGVVGSDTFVEQLRQMRADRDIRAVVLRIDSPGGSSVASDVIWRELMVTRDQNKSRPLVVSMSDLAASGGYYIATPGQVIVAEPGTLTGSIGVFTGKMVYEAAMDKIGVTEQTVKDGANADIDSPFARFTPDQRTKMQDLIQGFYDNFVEKVAQSRHTTPQRIDQLGQGRVWTGAQAKDRGLVDALGGLDTAIAIAKQRANIPASDDVELVSYPPRRSLYQTLTEEFRGASSELGAWGLLADDAHVRALGSLTAPVRLFRRNEPLALMPFAFAR
jgi:protease-4